MAGSGILNSEQWVDTVTPRTPTDAEPGTDFGRTLRALRTERGLTLRGLAHLLDVSPATISAIENGRTGISAARMAHLADVLDVPVGRMYDLVGDGPPALRPPSAGTGSSEPTRRTRLPGAHWRRFDPLVLDPALTGALSCFLEFGYHGATMRTIAERAELSVAGLYHHHASKHDMLVAILDLTMGDLQARSLAAREEGDDPVTRFALLVECLALFHTHRRELGFVGSSEMRSLDPGARERVALMRREQQLMVDVEVEAGVGSGAFSTTRPHQAARAVVTMCTAMTQWFHTDGPATAEEVAAEYVGFALALVGAAPARGDGWG